MRLLEKRWVDRARVGGTYLVIEFFISKVILYITPILD